MPGKQQSKGYDRIPTEAVEDEKPYDVDIEPVHDDDDEHLLAARGARRHGRQPRCTWIVDKRFTVPLICLVVTLVLSIHFDCPSTLYLYLAYLFVGFPMDIAYELYPRATNTDNGGANVSKSRRIGKLRAMHLAKLLAAFSIWCWALASPLLGLSLHPGPIGDSQAGMPSSLLLKPLAATTATRPTTPTHRPQGPIFLAANLYNSAHLFPRFTSSLLDLIDTLEGPSNIYVSLYESNSADGGQMQHHLADLDSVLAARNVSRRIHWGGDTFREERVGKEDRKRGRIRYLAKVRNEALRPLDEGLRGIDGRDFTKVLWLNDIVFDAPSIMTLLDTMGGAYDLACAFDYIPLGLYDTWVTRDVEGFRTKPLWPYFERQSDVEKLQRGQPISVNSCWNGAAAFDAKWFVLPANSSGGARAPTIRFRTSSKCHSSECLLASLDIHKHHRSLDPTSRPRIYMNPLVSVAYEARIYFLYNGLMKWTIVQPWHVVWEGWVSSWLFKRWTDVGRKEPSCREAFKDDWTPPPPSSSEEEEDRTAIIKAASR